jgi:hypothetical protein
MGEQRWLTVTSPEGMAGVGFVLEPMAFPPACVCQKALFDAGIPATSFTTTNIAAEYDRLRKLGVKFRTEPTDMGLITAALFEDTCGNLLYHVARDAGWRAALRQLLLAVTVAWPAEAAGQRWAVPFGARYDYHAGLRPHATVRAHDETLTMPALSCGPVDLRTQRAVVSGWTGY